MARWCWLTSAIILATSCGTRSTVVPRRPPDRSKWSVASAPPPSSRVVAPSAVERLTRGMDAHFEGRPGRRIHIQLDRPIYQPGDTIWVKTWHLRSRDLSGEHGNQELHYQLISPRGTVVVDHWKIMYEDGDEEDMDWEEIQQWRIAEKPAMETTTTTRLTTHAKR